MSTTGQLGRGAWFRGDIALFGGVEWQATDQITVVLEYSSDLYDRETTRGVVEVESPINAGVTCAFDNGVDLGIHSLYGNEIGVVLNYTFDPRKALVPGGSDPAPAPILARGSEAAATWSDPEGVSATIEEQMTARPEDEGIVLDALVFGRDTATIRIENFRWGRRRRQSGARHRRWQIPCRRVLKSSRLCRLRMGSHFLE